MVPSSAGNKVQAKSPFQKGIAVHQGRGNIQIASSATSRKKGAGAGGLLGEQQVSLNLMCRYGEGHRQAGRRVGRGWQ